MPTRPRGSARTLLSDVEGRITHVALAFPTYQTEGVPRLRDCLSGVLTALGPRVRRSVLHHAGDEELLRTLPRNPFHIVEILKSAACSRRRARPTGAPTP